MSASRKGYSRAIQEFQRLRTIAFKIEVLIDEDMVRMTEVMQQYASAEIDYTNAAIMAVAERLNITDIYTFDRRDFQVFRPRHCDYLRLLP